VSKRLRLIAAILLFTGAMGYLIFNGMRQGVGQLLTIEEALAKNIKENVTFIRMEGTVDYTTAFYDPLKPQLVFDLTDGSNKIPVIFEDVKPDNFDAGYPIIVEGRFLEDGRFRADKLLVKCPSKYEEESK
jgi:cytochrome c-type biogenesis protein CcmE